MAFGKWHLVDQCIHQSYDAVHRIAQLTDEWVVWSVLKNMDTCQKPRENGRHLVALVRME